MAAILGPTAGYDTYETIPGDGKKGGKKKKGEGKAKKATKRNGPGAKRNPKPKRNTDKAASARQLNTAEKRATQALRDIDRVPEDHPDRAKHDAERQRIERRLAEIKREKNLRTERGKTAEQRERSDTREASQRKADRDKAAGRTGDQDTTPDPPERDTTTTPEQDEATTTPQRDAEKRERQATAQQESRQRRNDPERQEQRNAAREATRKRINDRNERPTPDKPDRNKDRQTGDRTLLDLDTTADVSNFRDLDDLEKQVSDRAARMAPEALTEARAKVEAKPQDFITKRILDATEAQHKRNMARENTRRRIEDRDKRRTAVARRDDNTPDSTRNPNEQDEQREQGEQGDRDPNWEQGGRPTGTGNNRHNGTQAEQEGYDDVKRRLRNVNDEDFQRGYEQARRHAPENDRERGNLRAMDEEAKRRQAGGTQQQRELAQGTQDRTGITGGNPQERQADQDRRALGQAPQRNESNTQRTARNLQERQARDTREMGTRNRRELGRDNGGYDTNHRPGETDDDLNARLRRESEQRQGTERIAQRNIMTAQAEPGEDITDNGDIMRGNAMISKINDNEYMVKPYEARTGDQYPDGRAPDGHGESAATLDEARAIADRINSRDGRDIDRNRPPRSVSAEADRDTQQPTGPERPRERDEYDRMAEENDARERARADQERAARERARADQERATRQQQQRPANESDSLTDDDLEEFENHRAEQARRERDARQQNRTPGGYDGTADDGLEEFENERAEQARRERRATQRPGTEREHDDYDNLAEVYAAEEAEAAEYRQARDTYGQMGDDELNAETQRLTDVINQWGDDNPPQDDHDEMVRDRAEMDYHLARMEQDNRNRDAQQAAVEQGAGDTNPFHADPPEQDFIGDDRVPGDPEQSVRDRLAQIDDEELFEMSQQEGFDDLSGAIEEELEYRAPGREGGIIDSMLPEGNIRDLKAAYLKYGQESDVPTSDDLRDMMAGAGHPRHIREKGDLNGVFRAQYHDWLRGQVYDYDPHLIGNGEYDPGNLEYLFASKNVVDTQGLREEMRQFASHIGFVPNAQNYARILRGEDPIGHYSEDTTRDLGRASGRARRGRTRDDRVRDELAAENRRANRGDRGRRNREIEQARAESQSAQPQQSEDREQENRQADPAPQSEPQQQDTPTPEPENTPERPAQPSGRDIRTQTPEQRAEAAQRRQEQRQARQQATEREQQQRQAEAEQAQQQQAARRAETSEELSQQRQQARQTRDDEYEAAELTDTELREAYDDATADGDNKARAAYRREMNQRGMNTTPATRTAREENPAPEQDTTPDAEQGTPDAPEPNTADTPQAAEPEAKPKPKKKAAPKAKPKTDAKENTAPKADDAPQQSNAAKAQAKYDPKIGQQAANAQSIAVSSKRKSKEQRAKDIDKAEDLELQALKARRDIAKGHVADGTDKASHRDDIANYDEYVQEARDEYKALREKHGITTTADTNTGTAPKPKAKPKAKSKAKSDDQEPNDFKDAKPADRDAMIYDIIQGDAYGTDEIAGITGLSRQQARASLNRLADRGLLGKADESGSDGDLTGGRSRVDSNIVWSDVYRDDSSASGIAERDQLLADHKAGKSLAKADTPQVDPNDTRTPTRKRRDAADEWATTEDGKGKQNLQIWKDKADSLSKAASGAYGRITDDAKKEIKNNPEKWGADATEFQERRSAAKRLLNAKDKAVKDRTSQKTLDLRSQTTTLSSDAGKAAKQATAKNVSRPETRAKRLNTAQEAELKSYEARRDLAQSEIDDGNGVQRHQDFVKNYDKGVAEINTRYDQLRQDYGVTRDGAATNTPKATPKATPKGEAQDGNSGSERSRNQVIDRETDRIKGIPGVELDGTAPTLTVKNDLAQMKRVNAVHDAAERAAEAMLKSKHPNAKDEIYVKIGPDTLVMKPVKTTSMSGSGRKVPIYKLSTMTTGQDGKRTTVSVDSSDPGGPISDNIGKVLDAAAANRKANPAPKKAAKKAAPKAAPKGEALSEGGSPTPKGIEALADRLMSTEGLKSYKDGRAKDMQGEPGMRLDAETATAYSVAVEAEKAGLKLDGVTNISDRLNHRKLIGTKTRAALIRHLATAFGVEMPETPKPAKKATAKKATAKAKPKNTGPFTGKHPIHRYRGRPLAQIGNNLDADRKTATEKADKLLADGKKKYPKGAATPEGKKHMAEWLDTQNQADELRLAKLDMFREYPDSQTEATQLRKAIADRNATAKQLGLTLPERQERNLDNYIREHDRKLSDAKRERQQNASKSLIDTTNAEQASMKSLSQVAKDFKDGRINKQQLDQHIAEYKSAREARIDATVTYNAEYAVYAPDYRDSETKRLNADLNRMRRIANGKDVPDPQGEAIKVKPTPVSDTSDTPTTPDPSAVARLISSAPDMTVKGAGRNSRIRKGQLNGPNRELFRVAQSRDQDGEKNGLPVLSGITIDKGGDNTAVLYGTDRFVINSAKIKSEVPDSFFEDKKGRTIHGGQYVEALRELDPQGEVTLVQVDDNHMGLRADGRTVRIERLDTDAPRFGQLVKAGKNNLTQSVDSTAIQKAITQAAKSFDGRGKGARHVELDWREDGLHITPHRESALINYAELREPFDIHIPGAILNSDAYETTSSVVVELKNLARIASGLPDGQVILRPNANGHRPVIISTPDDPDVGIGVVMPIRRPG